MRNRADATPRVACAPVDVLTRRERDVASLASGGETSRAIAERLGISERTVENHLQRVFNKLGVGSRAELGVALEYASTR